MTRCLRRWHWVGLLVAFVGAPALFAESSDEVVKLPPFTVNDFSSRLGFTWNVQLEKERVRSVTFIRIERRSLAERAGLLPNDELIAMGSSPVQGLTIDQFQALFARDGQSGRSVEWTFVVQRGGVVKTEHSIVVRMRVR